MSPPAAAADARSAPRFATLVTVGVFATVALSALLLVGFIHSFAVDFATREARLRLEQLSWQMRDELNRVVQKADGDVALLSQIPKIHDLDHPQEIRAVLENLQRIAPDYAWIGMATPDGKVLASTQGVLEGGDVGKRPWFIAGRESLTAVDYHPALLLEKYLPHAADPWRFVDVAAPVQAADGRLMGVLGVHMSWAWARNLAHNLLTPTNREFGAEIIVTRTDGTVLLGPDALVEKTLRTDSLNLARAGKTGTVTERWPDGNTYLTGYSRSGKESDKTSLQWLVLARLGGDEFVAVLDMLAGPHNAEEAAGKLIKRLQAPFTLNTATVQLSASIGVALHMPNDAQQVDKLLSRADDAMYRAKHQGKNCVVVAPPACTE